MKHCTHTLLILVSLIWSDLSAKGFPLLTKGVAEEITCHGGLAQVALTGNKLGIICPATKADLNSKFTGTPPDGYSLVWFDNDIASGIALSHPNAVEPGIYYAFFYNSQAKCYNVAKSTSFVNVATQGPCETRFDLTVFLSGAMKAGGGAAMRNDLQTASLLPSGDPYSGTATCPDINDTTSIGQIVDWILVEIRSQNAPYEILQSKSLLLKSDGSMIGPDGQQPSFGQIKQSFRIAIKHRNHLSVLSNIVSHTDTGDYHYNFTANFTSAFLSEDYPNPLNLINGLWAMWGGDVNQDGGIDTPDHNAVVIAKNSGTANAYQATDINLDGIVDQADANIVYTSNGWAVTSALNVQ